MKEVSEYEKQAEEFSVKFHRSVAEKIQELVDTYLIYFKEPNSYRTYRHFATVVGDALILWVTTEELLAITPEYVASDEDRATIKARLAAAGSENQAADFIKAADPSSGAYL